MRAFNRTREEMLGSSIRRAEGVLSRMRGLLGTKGLAEGEGLWIAPCRSVHSFGMGYPIDVLFLDPAGEVVGVVPALSPNRVTPRFSRAAGALELPSGVIGATGTERGDRVEFVEAPGGLAGAEEPGSGSR